ncbi:MAG: ABC transporter ATP-binding protein [Proteobacteria bacterium]|nr:MAG: ABC transporter ATP-binding protein [Pseudomonadota bacterium]
MSSEVVIKVKHLNKCFEIYDSPRKRLLQMLFRGRRRYFKEFWALKDISFEVRKGEVVGIVGRNGSGKSTLLQLLCGTLYPTSGEIEVTGRVAALLELGSGFNHDFTGRENIFTYGALLGLKKKRDSESAPGTSILLVTHSSEQIIQHCTRAILLDGGVKVLEDEPRIVINRYMDLLFGRHRKIVNTETTSVTENIPDSCSKIDDQNLDLSTNVFSTRPGYNKSEYRWGDGSAEILDFVLRSTQLYPAIVDSGDVIQVHFSVKFHSNIERPIFGINVRTKEGVMVCGTNSELQRVHDFETRGQRGSVSVARFRFEAKLTMGDYFISLGVASHNGFEVVPHDRRYDSIHFTVGETKSFYGLADLNMELMID